MRKFLKIILVCVMGLSGDLGFATGSLAEMSKWKVDHDHSTVGFQVAHMVVSNTKGNHDL